MSLRRLIGISSAAVSVRSLSGRLPHTFSTAAASSHPPWAVIDRTTRVDRSSSAPGACFRPVEPPAVSRVSAPAHLIDPSQRPGAGSTNVLHHLGGNVVQLLFGTVDAASGDGHLLLSYHDHRAEGPCTTWDLTGDPEIHRFVCNPLTGQMLRLPDIGGSRRIIVFHHMGLLTQADARLGNGPPDRFAVAELIFDGAAFERFLSDEGEWRTVMGVPRGPLLRRQMEVNQETVAFGGRLWWVDLAFGAISVDPFADWPETRFVELPSGSVLPARASTNDGDFGELEDKVMFKEEVAKHRRIGVSEGRLRYAEVSPHDPFLLSSFALDGDEGSGWTLEHQVALRQVLADGGYPWQENSTQAAPQIAVLDPLNANVIYLKVGEHIVVVDVNNGKVIGASPLEEEYLYLSLVPCVLPPWLGSSRIPTPGKSNGMEATDDPSSFCIVRTQDRLFFRFPGSNRWRGCVVL
ncbi:uncharacterized protein [Triticum aestivum]|uniref:uncharacterized protein isoform X1 n=1 Tax=Triticum aestivum TaxID=4565 RepID=UPI001D0181DA|nr:uncharacterized protein LOC123110332 isoform X1 [Triticum aestivum]